MRDHDTQVTAQSRHLSASSTIGDVLLHPTFAAFGRLILPWDGRGYDDRQPLSGIASLLPYHSHVDTLSVVDGLNRMIDDAADGRKVFYDIYSDAERRADPTKENTGLFFFRGKSGAPFAIVAPGGGFAYVGSVHEGFPYATEISKLGFNVFVIRYRAGQGGKAPAADLATAISYIFENAGSLDVATDGYSLWGSSAGARMVAAVGSHGVAAFGGAMLPKPAALVMAYTAHSDVSNDEPPTFVVVGADDAIAPPASMEKRIAALRQMGTPVAYRKYPALGHGFGLGIGTSAQGWITDATEFWEQSREPRSTPP
ncbi:esterase [Pararhizobium polonicum]|uniref:Esterase n=1 Tax=Pararhizobium polonicum TaxID=1612624 RepID=A0A1C7P168_9HYPH|nr:esterase [Pararhizobium polonicum]